MDAPQDLRGPEWFRRITFYELPVRSFCDSNGDGIGDLPGVTSKLDYLQDLGIGAIWLLPFFLSPWRDDGYDISDYYRVDPRFGTIDDLDRLVEEAHRRDIRVLGDLVTNHVSDQHPWFQEARKDRSSPYRSWFLWSDTGREFSLAPVIFPDFEPSNWTWDELAGQYYFHRFFHWQPDLNYDNPAVPAELLKVARFWLDHGLDGFRCDAVPYLFKREGTACENLPEVHGFFGSLRTMMDREFPGTVLLAEANQSIPKSAEYFGRGREFQMVFHYPAVPSLFLAVADRTPGRLLQVIRSSITAARAGGAWAYYLRNHDGLNPGPLSEEERERFFRAYDTAPGARVHHELRRRLAPLLAGDDRSVLLLISVILGLPGVPFLYYGDEIGMGDRLDLPDRDPVRTPMQWTNGPSAGFSSAPPEQLTRPLVADPQYVPVARNVAMESSSPGFLLNKIRTLLRVRRAHAAAFGGDQFELVDLPESPIVAFWRGGSKRRILCLHNFSTETVPVEAPVRESPGVPPVDLIGFGSSWTVSNGTFRALLEGRGSSWTLFATPPLRH
jgi:maltose alpha-D-glucosyltransferase/alpha-amylase